jgi:PAT family beta-lactamase induction signal transducer AmpG
MVDRTVSQAPQSRGRRWRESFAVYAEPAALRMLLLGFSAGLPLVLVFGTLSLWLREAGIARTTIGFISWVTLAYSLKWTWAPLVDRLPLPWLTRRFGRRRAWLLAAQATIALALVGMALSDPRQALFWLVLFAVVTAFASATQDIALDAYRIESAPVEQQAALAATYQAGYRVAMIWAGAGALTIAAWVDPTARAGAYQHLPWTIAYLAMAASMAVGIVTTLLAPEPAARVDLLPAQGTRGQRLARWLQSAAVEPFVDFFTRFGWHALLILALIATYRISDVVLGVMANPFYTDQGFSKEEIAVVSKTYGLVMTLVGAFIGGALALRFGVLRVLFAGALLSAASNLLFAWMATQGHDVWLLTWVISADNLSAGIASSAFIAYLSGLTNVAYTATQYALFSSTMLLLPKFVGGFSGWVVDQVGYVAFFVGTAALGLPVLILIVLVSRHMAARAASAPAATPDAAAETRAAQI